jgi:hypothetical protein
VRLALPWSANSHDWNSLVGNLAAISRNAMGKFRDLRAGSNPVDR